MLNLQVAALVVFAAGALPKGCGGSLGSLTGNTKVQVGDLCKTLPAQEFPGNPLGGQQTVERKFEVDVGELLDKAGGLNAEDMEAELQSLTFKPVSGIEDFGFVESASLDAAGERVAQYQRPAGGVAVKDLVIKGNGVELTQFAEGEKVSLVARLSGLAPASAWSASVVACYKVSMEVANGDSADGGEK